jgi:hypothetical protein
VSDLESLIRAAARTGRLNHLSIGFIAGEWSASYRGVADSDKRIVGHVDPVDALVSALTGRKAPAIEKPKVAAQRKRVATPSKDEFEGLL